MPSLTRDRRGSDITLADNTFFISNKRYASTRVEAWGKHRTAVGTPRGELNCNQLWQLKASADFRGYFYIESVEHKHFRLSLWNGRDGRVMLFNGNLFDDQLWSFQQDRDGYYTITNKLYPDCRLAKWGAGRHEWGACAGASGDGERWRLTPRFAGKLAERGIWRVDNRNGGDFCFRELSYTVGVTVNDRREFRKRRGFKEAIGLSLRAECDGTFLSSADRQRLSMELSNTESCERTDSWAQQQSLTIAIPPGKVYTIKQLVCSFESPIPGDSCTLYGNYETVESE